MDCSLESVSPESIELCKFCLAKRSKYVCPRCGIPYCSVGCYRTQTHSDCSEAFYQEWVEEELKGSKVSCDGKKRMMEILSKISNDDMHFDDGELDSDDDASLPDLSERLAEVNIDDPDAVWGKLSEAEQAAFKELINTGEIAKLIPDWEPWWCIRVEESKIIDLNDESELQAKLQEIHKKCPPLSNGIKPLSEITKIKPSFSVTFDLINILGSYTITVRYFNGSHYDFAEEAATIIHRLSKSLVSPQKFTCADMALDAVGLESLTYKGIEVTQDDLELMKEDVKRIIDGPSCNDCKYYMLSALSDMQRIFCYNGNDSKKGKFLSLFPNGDVGVELLKRDDYKATVRRLKYFLSWVLEYSDF